MFRSYQTHIDINGTGRIDISPMVEAVEWDVYQISVQTGTQAATCTAQISHNEFFLCATNYGFRDSAHGPPDVVVLPADMLTVTWAGGTYQDTATVGIWYNQVPTGTTYSTAH
jgi:hypothetical protein